MARKGPNTSSAVMAQRNESRDALDDFPTPPWATRALCEYLVTEYSLDFREYTLREPTANRGYMVEVLREYCDHVEAADVHDYGVGYDVADYLSGPAPSPVDWTITNPPFRLAEEFVQRALRSSRVGVAILVRTAWLEGCGRHDRLFSVHPPHMVLQFSERVVMHKGKVTATGSTATAYAWVIWNSEAALSEIANFYDVAFAWTPPGTRRRLTREGDYDQRGAAP